MTKVKCALCKNEFTIEGSFDEDINSITECPHCYIKMNTIFFEFLSSNMEEEK